MLGHARGAGAEHDADTRPAMAVDGPVDRGSDLLDGRASIIRLLRDVRGGGIGEVGSGASPRPPDSGRSRNRSSRATRPSSVPSNKATGDVLRRSCPSGVTRPMAARPSTGAGRHGCSTDCTSTTSRRAHCDSSSSPSTARPPAIPVVAIHRLATARQGTIRCPARDDQARSGLPARARCTAAAGQQIATRSASRSPVVKRCRAGCAHALHRDSGVGPVEAVISR